MSRIADFFRAVADFFRSLPERIRDLWDWYGGLERGRQLLYGGGAAAGVTLAAVIIVLVAGGGSTATTTTTTTTTAAAPTTTTTTSSTTTTTVATGPVSPLNGLAAEDPAKLDRRVLAVKIDNHPNAQPQSGIDEADWVYELLVEGGFSRFIAVFHDNDTDYLGPIRSGRPTDPTLIRPFEPVMIISGAQPWIEQLIVGSDIKLIGEGPGTFRIDSRFAPHNLYGDTMALREVADQRGYPDDPPGVFFEIGPYGGTEPAVEVNVGWDVANRVLWIWDGQKYVRYTNELPHNVIDRQGNEEQISTDILVVLTGTLYTATPTGAGSAVPAMETVGNGTAYVFAEGKVQEGTWSRDVIEEPFVLRDEEGAPMAVPPGRPWVSFFPQDGPLTWTATPTG